MTAPRDFLDQLNSSVICLGLDAIRGLMRSLGDPQDAYAALLIGGTNGKGSIAATAASILREAGYRVGLYTSPHLVDLRERIVVNGEMIPEAALDELIEEVRGALSSRVTYFEFLTALAFLYFARMRVQLAVLEVGMGGRLDATNLVHPLVSVISTISLEHREYLGNTLAAIAREKGGIIREGGQCITAARQRRVRTVLEEICRDRRATLFRLGRDFRVRGGRGGAFSYYGMTKTCRGLTSPLFGRHQRANAACALAALERLSLAGFPAGDEALRRGVAATRWEGRFETLQETPRVIVDGGHNAAGMTVLARTLEEAPPCRRLILVFAVLSDKDYRRMLATIAPLAGHIICTRPRTGRAVAPGITAEVARRHCNAVEVIEDVAAALGRALSLAGPDDLVLAAGSLYLVGEVKQAFSALRREGALPGAAPPR